MELHPIRSPARGDAVPEVLRKWLRAFRPHVTGPTWQNLLVLVMGALLAPGKRTVSACLRMTGRAEASNFTIYHQVLNRGRWKGRALARTLLDLVVGALVPEGPVIIGVDDTIERRWGARISARGIYRDPVRSSHGHFVKTSGLRWLSLMVLAPVPWAGRVWALPFLTVLAPSERYHADRGRRHKTLTDWARQAILCVCRWLPDRSVIMVGDSSFAAVELIAAVRSVCTVISRLRLDANLFAPPPERQPGHRGRPAIKGPRLPKLGMRLTDPRTVWSTVTVTGWYGEDSQTLQITSDVAVWYRSGLPPVPIRWVLVRDPSGERQPQAFFSTDTTADPTQILAWFVRRWQVEVTFEECRAQLGVERQWSDRAILRTTPALFGLYSLVTLWATTVFDAAPQPRDAAWYDKTRLTFSDAIATVRYRLWLPENFLTSTQDATTHKIPATLVNRLVDALCYAA